MAAGLNEPDLTDRTQPEWSRVWLVLAACACATGGALIVHITARVSLAFAAGALLVLSVTVFTLVLRRLDPVRRREVVRRLQVGAAAGLVATIAYDLARFGVVALFDLSFQPFHVFELFGQGLLGSDVTGSPAFVTGALFHFVNGTGFGIAFALLVRKPTIVKGIVWAMFLEAAMVAFYPSWLQLQALGEFLEISVLAHAVYGTTLGALCRRRLAP